MNYLARANNAISVKLCKRHISIISVNGNLLLKYRIDTIQSAVIPIQFEASNSIFHLQALLLRQSFAAIIAEIKILCHGCSAVRAKLIIDIARFLRFGLRIAEALV